MIQTLTGIHSCNDLKAIKHANKSKYVYQIQRSSSDSRWIVGQWSVVDQGRVSVLHTCISPTRASFHRRPTATHAQKWPFYGNAPTACGGQTVIWTILGRSWNILEQTFENLHFSLGVCMIEKSKLAMVSCGEKTGGRAFAKSGRA